MSTSALKWTAFVLMVLDHLGEFFPGQIPLWFRYLGRMSAPLFLFCLAVGMRKPEVEQDISNGCGLVRR